MPRMKQKRRNRKHAAKATTVLLGRRNHRANNPKKSLRIAVFTAFGNSINYLRWPMNRKIVAVILAAGFLRCHIYACGVNWSLPTNHFQNASDQGVLSCWEKLGEIPTSGDLKLPIHINFRGNRNLNSSGLGAPGFMLGITDANAVALDENTFVFYTPAGRYKVFTRDSRQPAVLHGEGNWKGEIKEETITITSECGDRMTYFKGVIAQMQIKDQRFDFIRTGGKVTEIREAGRTLATMTKDPMTGSLSLNLPNGKNIVFEYGERPHVQKIGGTNVVASKLPSIKSITLADGTKLGFDFGVTADILPSLSFQNRELTWDPQTGIILRDGEWKYSVQQGEHPFDNAAIARKKNSGESEFWSDDTTKGIEIEIAVSGLRKKTVRFTSGIAKGSIRSLEIYQNDKPISKTTFSYDEKGRRFREIYEKGGEKTLVRFARETKKDGTQVVKALKNEGVLLWEKSQKPDGSTKEVTYSLEQGKSDKILERDPKGRQTYRRDDRGFEYQSIYDAAGRLQAILHGGKLQRRYLYDPVTNVLQKEVRFVEGGKMVYGIKNILSNNTDVNYPKYQWVGASELTPELRALLVKEGGEFLKHLDRYQ